MRGRFIPLPETVTAPIDGSITQLNMEEGQLCGMNTPLAVISGGDGFTITANINEAQIAKVAVGQRVIVTGSGFSGSYEGQVKRISGSAKQVMAGSTTETVVETRLCYRQSRSGAQTGVHGQGGDHRGHRLGCAFDSLWNRSAARGIPIMSILQGKSARCAQGRPSRAGGFTGSGGARRAGRRRSGRDQPIGCRAFGSVHQDIAGGEPWLIRCLLSTKGCCARGRALFFDPVGHRGGGGVGHRRRRHQRHRYGRGQPGAGQPGAQWIVGDVQGLDHGGYRFPDAGPRANSLPLLRGLGHPHCGGYFLCLEWRKQLRDGAVGD